MNDSTRQLYELKTRAQAGDAEAARELRGRLQPAIASLVRRALRFPGDDSPFEAAVREELGRLGLAAPGPPLAEDRQAVRLIAGRLCDAVVDRLYGAALAPSALETLRDW